MLAQPQGLGEREAELAAEARAQRAVLEGAAAHGLRGQADPLAARPPQEVGRVGVEGVEVDDRERGVEVRGRGIEPDAVGLGEAVLRGGHGAAGYVVPFRRPARGATIDGMSPRRLRLPLVLVAAALAGAGCGGGGDDDGERSAAPAPEQAPSVPRPPSTPQEPTGALAIPRRVPARRPARRTPPTSA